MNPWTYVQYARSIANDVAYGVSSLGFNIDQAIGYALDLLELRIDTYPIENVFALTAAATFAIHNGRTFLNEEDDYFRNELIASYSSGLIEAGVAALDAHERPLFLADVLAVRSVLGLP